MNELEKKKKLEFITKTSKKLGVTAYEFGNNTSISTFTARQILKGETENPSTNTIEAMEKYLDLKAGNNTTKDLQEPNTPYTVKNKTQLLRIAVEFAENYELLKDHSIVKNIIEIEVLKRLLEEKQ
jgi:hypothetical protein